MRLKDVIVALNLAIEEEFPNSKGSFIELTKILPTKINAYKKCVVDIYYHIEDKNINVLHKEITDRCLDSEKEKFKDSCLIVVLKDLFLNLEKIKNEIV